MDIPLEIEDDAKLSALFAAAKTAVRAEQEAIASGWAAKRDSFLGIFDFASELTSNPSRQKRLMKRYERKTGRPPFKQRLVCKMFSGNAKLGTMARDAKALTYAIEQKLTRDEVSQLLANEGGIKALTRAYDAAHPRNNRLAERKCGRRLTQKSGLTTWRSWVGRTTRRGIMQAKSGSRRREYLQPALPLPTKSGSRARLSFRSSLFR